MKATSMTFASALLYLIWVHLILVNLLVGPVHAFVLSPKYPIGLCSPGQVHKETYQSRSWLAFLPTLRSTYDDTATESLEGLSLESINHEAPKELSIDPLIVSALYDASSMELGGIVEASHGIGVWRQALLKGRLPVETEFFSVWPPSPLYSKLYKVVVAMELPRFALRHKETIPLILRSIMRMTLEFSRRLQDAHDDQEMEMKEDNDEDEDEDNDSGHVWEWEATVEATVDDDLFRDLVDERIAEEVSNALLKEWGGVIDGVSILDQLFGYDHGLLDTSDDETADLMGTTIGFGVQDGVWSHSGWEEIPKLQRQVSDIPGLNEMMRGLGRRPTAEDSKRIHKFVPRKRQKEGGLGAEFDPHRRESVSGITMSGSLIEMLPSEAVLLCGKSPALRRLFLAKKAESKLLSYQLSGWADVPSVPLTRPLYQRRMPSGPGGPIIVCLDTSWSMSGIRESLSKAVVLACVSAAHKQGRDCQVVAFSTERGTMEVGVITADSAGIQRLLAFLSHSFGGGTDVTGALRFAMATLEGDVMAAADILMITDGEIPDPPVPQEVMESLDRLKLQKGVEIHGLLVGKSESKPLSRLCTQTHDFLSKYDSMASYGFRRTSTSSPSGGRRDMALYARRSSHDDGDAPRDGKRREKGKTNNRADDEDDTYNDSQWNDDEDEDQEDDDASSTSSQFAEDVAVSLDQLTEAAKEIISKQLWTPEELEREHSENESCWKIHLQLNEAVKRVEEGLVERGEDARLVVLSMIASEHILLLGVPGTGKSILGQRLAELCGGAFFQRLLTRFTTPEELFGPLSLKSLENDEYRRCITGFLPTADIAFLDEIFKANSAILNTLLTILNERKFDNAGGRESCPIRCVVGASNELPESDELVALFDRFLIRKEVVPVSDIGVLDLLSMSNPGKSSYKSSDGSDCGIVFADGLDEAIEALSSAADSVIMDADARELMREIRTYMRQEQNVEISDRRLVKAARLLKISAASDGRQKVDMLDFLLLQHCFWDQPEQRVAIREWLWENVTPGEISTGSSIDQLRFLLDGLRNEISSALRKTSGDIDGNSGGRPEDLAVIANLRQEAGRIGDILQERLNSLARHIELIARSEEFTWIEVDDATAMKQLMLPRAEALRVEVNKASEDARALELSLTSFPGAPKPEIRIDVINALWEEGFRAKLSFTEAELAMSMKESKARYDLETFRRWKRMKKKLLTR